MPDRKDAPSREWLLEYLRADRGSFPEYMIISWAIVEQNIDTTLIGEFGLLDYVPPEPGESQGSDSVEAQLRDVLKRTTRKESRQVELLLDLPFYKKMDCLREIEAIEKKEYLMLSKFRKDRNDCFHGAIWGPLILKLTDERRTFMTKNAENAVDASYQVMSRLLERLKHSSKRSRL